MKYLKITFYSICFIASFLPATKCAGVTLGFSGPDKMINPGEVFDVSLVAYFAKHFRHLALWRLRY